MCAIITDEIDSFAHATEETEQLLKEKHSCLAVDLNRQDERIKKKRKKLDGRGSRIPQELADRLKYLFPLASSQLLAYCQHKVSAAIENEPSLQLHDLKLSEAEVT